MLATHLHPLFDQQLYRPRINGKITHCRGKEIILLAGDRVKNMLDRDVVLISLFRFVERSLKHTPPALAEFIFVYVYVCHIKLNTAGKFDAGRMGNSRPETIITFQKRRREEILGAIRPRYSAALDARPLPT